MTSLVHHGKSVLFGAVNPHKSVVHASSFGFNEGHAFFLQSRRQRAGNHISSLFQISLPRQRTHPSKTPGLKGSQFHFQNFIGMEKDEMLLCSVHSVRFYVSRMQQLDRPSSDTCSF